MNLSILFVYLTDKRTPKYDMDRDITELWNLVASLGDATVTDLIVQKGKPVRATFIGSGKTEEVGQYLATHDTDIVLFNALLSPEQKFTLTKMYWDTRPAIRVWDRVDLILEIFSRHAHTREATLQIDLARMRHMGPAIFGMGKILSRQGGGVGTRGIGETNTELMKRHWRREMKRVGDELKRLVANRRAQIENRKSRGLLSVSLVGYTNAGKTTLFNALTGKKKTVNDAMFVTLDSTVGKVFLSNIGKTITVSDTIGFIRDLPPDLIDAFKSTLLESISADIVLHVADISDPNYLEKMAEVDTILEQLEIDREKIIYVFNKTDAAKDDARQKASDAALHSPHVFISASGGIGIGDLMHEITKRISI